VADVRAIANLVLERADALHIDVSNMALNKIVYFVHCDHLVERHAPLVSAKIEAWKHGPVFREIYHEFKSWDDSPIKGRATRVDPNTGEVARATERSDAGAQHRRSSAKSAREPADGSTRTGSGGELDRRHGRP